MYTVLRTVFIVIKALKDTMSAPVYEILLSLHNLFRTVSGSNRNTFFCQTLCLSRVRVNDIPQCIETMKDAFTLITVTD